MPKSVRRVRDEERGEGEGRRSARPGGVPAWLVVLLIIMGAGVLAGGLVIAAVAYRYSRAAAATAPQALVYSGDVKGLRQAYHDNEVRADATYKDRYVRITGRLSGIRKDSWSGSTVLDLDAGGILLGFVRCEFDHDDPAAIQRLNNGDTVSIEGQCKGLRSDSLQIIHCRIAEQ